MRRLFLIYFFVVALFTNQLYSQTIRAFCEGDNKIFIGDSINGVFVSSDFGNTWKYIGLKGETIFNLLYSRSEGKLYAGLSGARFVKKDETNTWHTVYTGTISGGDIVINSKGDLFLTDWNLIGSKDYGTTWSKILEYRNNYYFVHAAIDSNGRIYVGEVNNSLYQASRLYYSSDAGSTWNYSYEGRAIGYIYTDPNQSVYFTNGDDLYISSDYGKTFSIITVPKKNQSDYRTLRNITKIRNTLFVLDSYSETIFRSSDSGSNWENIKIPFSGDPILTMQPIADSLLFISYLNHLGIYKSKDLGASWSASIPTKIEKVETKIEKLSSQNYPNPFNSTTTIQFSVPTSGNVTIKLYDILGREVMELSDSYLIAGAHTIQLDANKLTSGLYYYRIFAGAESFCRKIVLLK